MRKVMRDVGMVHDQSAGCRFVAVSLFGDGERDDLHRRVGHGRNNGTRVFRRDDHIGDGFDDLRRLFPRCQRYRAVNATLGDQLIARRRAAQAHRQDTPVTASLSHRLMRIDCVEGPKEGAGPEVDNADFGRKAAAL